MDPLDQQLQAGFRQWDEQRLRLRLFKQQLRQRQDRPPDETLDRLSSELRSLEGQYDASFERLLELIRLRRPPA
jgi:hypothetical protein